MEMKIINANYDTNTSEGRVLSLFHAFALANGNINEQAGKEFLKTTAFYESFVKKAVRRLSFSEAMAETLTENGFVQTNTWHLEGKNEGKNMSVKAWLKKRSGEGAYLLALTNKEGTKIPHWAVIIDGVYYDTADNSGMFVVGAFTNNTAEDLFGDDDTDGNA